MGRRGKGERDAVKSRKLKVEDQTKRRKIQRRDAEPTEIAQRCVARCGAAGLVAKYQTLRYHTIIILVNE